MKKTCIKKSVALSVIYLILLLPVVQSISISSIKVLPDKETAVVTVATNENSDVRINYGISATQYKPILSSASKSKIHILELPGLKLNSNYLYKVIATDSDGDVTQSDDLGFKTLDDIDPIKTVNLKAKEISTSTVLIGWDKIILDSDINGYNVYRNNEKLKFVAVNEYLDTGLLPGSTYEYSVDMVDKAGYIGERSDKLKITTKAPDKNNPIILENEIVSMSEDKAVVKIVVDEDSIIEINYGIQGIESKNESTVKSTEFKVEHSLSLQIVKDKVYKYDAKVCDLAGNCQTDTKTFTGGDDIIPPFIEAEIPEIHNSFVLDIKGKTEPLSTIHLFVNGKRDSLMKTKIDGEFILRATSLEEGKNTLKFEATDTNKNKNEKVYNLNIDTSRPGLNLTELPGVLFENIFTVTGFVDKQVNIKYTVQGQTTSEKLIPPNRREISTVKIEDFNFSPPVISIGRGDSVVWENIGETQHTVIGENFDSGILNPGDKFTHKFTQPGEFNYGCSIHPNMKAKIIVEEVETQTAEDKTILRDPRSENVNAEGDFKFDLNLNEGENEVKITVTDSAGNIVEFSKLIIVDTVPPVILEPTDLSFFSPAYSPGVEITGRVDTPFATVIVSVNGEEDASGVIPISVSGVVESIKQAATGNIYETKADEFGNFEVLIELEQISRVDLDNDLDQGGFRRGEVGGRGEIIAGGRFRDETFDQNLFVENKIKIIAIDDNGQVSEPFEDVIEYQNCGTGGQWDVQIPRKEFSPSAIFSEHLLQGIAQFGFNINLEYRAGLPESAKISGEPSLTEFKLSQAEADKIGSEALLRSPSVQWNEDFTKGHALYTLKQFPDAAKLDQFSFLTFPLLIEFDYEHEVFGQKRRGNQKTCISLKVDLEKRLDVEGHIPEKFLEDSIAVINQTLSVINQILPPLQQAQTILLFSCLGSWVALWLVNTFYYELTCFPYRKEATRSMAIEEKWPNSESIPDSETCEGVTDKGSVFGGDESTCTGCKDKYKQSRDLTKLMHLLCDRVFCPSVPTLSEHSKTYRDTYLAGITKTNDGEPINNACYDKYNEVYYGEKVNEEDVCKKEYEREWSYGCLLMDEWDKTTTDPAKEDPFNKIYSGVADMCKPEKAKATKKTITFPGERGKREYIAYRDDQGNEYLYEVTGKTSEINIDLGSDNQPIFTQNNTDSDKLITSQNKADVYTSYARWQNCVDRRKTSSDASDCTGLDNEHMDVINEYNNGPGKSDPITQGELQTLHKNKILETSGEKYVVDPTSGILRSIQCVCIPALTGYIQYWKAVLEAVNKCFKSILVTKNAQSGLCRAVLTTYLCDLLFDAFNCVTKRFNTKGLGSDVTEPTKEGITGFFDSIKRGTEGVQNSVQNRYGQTSVFRNLFNDRKLVHALCIGAFSGDWDLNVEGLLQASTRVPIASEGFIPVATRRFITSDPLNDGITTHIYHVGAGLIAGSDLDYKLELVCSNDNTCKDSGSFGNECDCARLGNEEVKVLDAGNLNQGESIGDGDEGDLYISLSTKRRFDKARLTWRYVDNNNELQIKQRVADINQRGDNPPLTCEYSITELSFLCEAIIQKGGQAKFLGKPTPIKEAYSVGETINLDLAISKKSPGFDKDDKSTVNQQLPFWVSVQVFNQFGTPLPLKDGATAGKGFEKLEDDGIYGSNPSDPGKVLLLPDLKIQESHFSNSRVSAKIPTSNPGLLTDFEPLSVQVAATNVNEEIVFAIKFIDELQYIIEDGEIDSNGKYRTIQLVVGPTEYSSGSIRYKQISVLPKSPLKGQGTVVILDPKNTDKSTGCKEGNWRIELELLKPVKKDPSLPLDFNNAEMGKQIATVNQEEQKFTGNNAIIVGIKCSGQAGGCSGEGFEPVDGPCKCADLNNDCGTIGDIDKRRWFCWKSGYEGKGGDVCTPYGKCNNGKVSSVCACGDNGTLAMLNSPNARGCVDGQVGNFDYCFRDRCYDKEGFDKAKDEFVASSEKQEIISRLDRLRDAILNKENYGDLQVKQLPAETMEELFLKAVALSIRDNTKVDAKEIIKKALETNADDSNLVIELENKLNELMAMLK